MFLVLIATILLIAYLYCSLTISHWDKFEVPYLRPHPIFGNLKDAVFLKKSIPQVYQTIYKNFKKSAYVGVYTMRKPAILLRDTNLIKDVLVKDFAHFHDNDFDVDPNHDPIFGMNPFVLKGEKWKTQRARHTPHFTTARMKSMFSTVDSSGDRMVRYIRDNIGDSDRFVEESMELASKFTIYNVGNCALGIDNKTFDEPNPEMRQMGRDIIEPGFISGLKQFIVLFIPVLSKLFIVNLVPKHVTERFRRIIKEQLDYRSRNNVTRNDFFDAIKESKASTTPAIEEMVVQVGGFFIDGFGTSSHVFSFALYELALNLDVQRKLRDEVDEVLAKCGGLLNYEVFQEMPYLEAFIYESLRKYPPLGAFVRVCTKPYTFPPSTIHSEPIKVEVNTPVIVPVMGLHYDETYFPQPDKFEPDRFLEEKKDEINKFAYLPFGAGPKECLGRRFGILQMKMYILKLVANFEIKLNEKTKDVKFDARSFLTAPNKPIFLDIIERGK